jgi:hypothetical protein
MNGEKIIVKRIKNNASMQKMNNIQINFILKLSPPLDKIIFFNFEILFFVLEYKATID